MQSTDISHIFDSLAARFPVCMASDEFHFFPQARARSFDWSLWDDFSANTLGETTGKMREWEKQIDRDFEQGPSLERQMDLAMTFRMLQTLREQFELVRVHETQPTFYLTIIGIGLAEAMESGITAMKKRSSTIAGFLDTATRNLTRIPRLFRGIGIEMVEEQQSWLKSLSISDDSIAPVRQSLRQFGDYLNKVAVYDDFLPRVELYERIAVEHMGCRIKPEDIARELEMEIEETESILTQSSEAMNSTLSWRETIAKLPYPPLPPGGVLELYRQTIAELSRHCISSGMIPKELVQQCPVEVQPIPEYMRPVRSNAAYSMPPGHPPRGGIFYLQNKTGDADFPLDYRLLTAHETFPGHHLLDTYRWRHQRPARRHIEFPLFYEGWASFSEELMFETGFFAGAVEQMLMAKRRFWRALRGKVDFDIHTRRKTPEQAADFLVSHGMRPQRAAYLIRRYVLKPGYQLAYTIGRRLFKNVYASARPPNKEPVAFARRVLALGEIGFNHLEQSINTI